MADAPSEVTGFYISFGSRDFPDNHSWDTPFGYNEGSLGSPVYHYSLTDAKNSFESPIQFLRNNPILNGQNSLLIAEGANNPNLLDQEIYNADWTAAFKIIDAVYANPALYASPADNWGDGHNYNNYGDLVFSEHQAGQENIPNYNVSDRYHTNSLVISYGKTQRIFDIEFSMTFKIASNAIGLSSGGIAVKFHIYYDPDYMIQQSLDLGLFRVYTYEDSDNNNEINNEEFEHFIVRKIHDILKSGKYKRVDKLETRHYIDPQPGETGYYVMQTFYVFSNFAETPLELVSMSQKKLAVKSYLETIYTTPAEREALPRWYPDLFTLNTVEIIPFYTDNSINSSGIINILHPLSGTVLKETLIKNGLTFDPANAQAYAYEIFYVGASTINKYIYRWPLIAVELSRESSVKRPISARFPDYIPKFGYSTETIDSDADRFHMFLILALNILNDSAVTVDDIPYEFQTLDWRDETAGNDRHVSFVFKNVTWKIKGPRPII
jgi:hypothetical protein